MEGKKMVVTKIEAGKYSIVTASGLKFNAMKQRNHYWMVQNDSLGIIAGYPTLKECEEWDSIGMEWWTHIVDNRQNVPMGICITVQR